MGKRQDDVFIVIARLTKKPKKSRGSGWDCRIAALLAMTNKGIEREAK